MKLLKTNAYFRPVSKYIAKLWQINFFLKKESILVRAKDSHSCLFEICHKNIIVANTIFNWLQK